MNTSTFEQLYNTFRAWIDPDKFGYQLKDNAPQEAKDAREKYFDLKAKYKKQGKTV